MSSSKRASCVLALSETCREVLVRHGVASASIVVTPNGVDNYWGNVSASKRPLTGLGINRPFLLYVSHFHRYKNHNRFVEAYASLPRSLRESNQLVLVGKPDSRACFDETLLLIKRLDLGANVIVIPGECSDTLRELYQRTVLFVFPTLIENSPNILMEAMMAGAPVATGRLAPMPEFCGSAAIYFDALDVSNMTTVMSRLLESPSLLSDMREKSRQQASKFSWDEFVNSMAQHIYKVLKSNVD